MTTVKVLTDSTCLNRPTCIKFQNVCQQAISMVLIMKNQWHLVQLHLSDQKVNCLLGIVNILEEKIKLNLQEQLLEQGVCVPQKIEYRLKDPLKDRQNQEEVKILDQEKLITHPRVKGEGINLKEVLISEGINQTHILLKGSSHQTVVLILVENRHLAFQLQIEAITSRYAKI